MNRAKRKHGFTKLLCFMAVSFALAVGSAQAALIEIEMTFPGGFNLSLNGGAAAPSGPLTFTGLIDNATPDLNPSPNRGDFAFNSVNITAPNYGFVAEPIVNPSPLLLRWYSGGFAIVDNPDVLDIGWNGGPTAPGNRDDLSTLALPTMIAPTNSTFFISTITMQSGDTLFANIGAGGPRGTFTARAAPEPGTLTLFALSVVGLGFVRRRRSK